MGPPSGYSVNLAYMGSQVDLDTTPNAYFREDLVYANDILDTENDSFGYIGTWVYNKDMLNVYNDGSPG